MYTRYTIDLREFDFDFVDPDKAGFPEYAPDGFRDSADPPAPHPTHRSSSDSGEPP